MGRLAALQRAQSVFRRFTRDGQAVAPGGGVSRLVRSLFLSIREREFVEAARAVGADEFIARLRPDRTVDEVWREAWEPYQKRSIDFETALARGAVPVCCQARNMDSGMAADDPG